MYDGELTDVKPLLQWLIDQKTMDTIEQITEEILKVRLMEKDFV